MNADKLYWKVLHELLIKDHLSSLEIIKLKSRSEADICTDKGVFFLICILKSMKQDLIWFFLSKSMDADMLEWEKTNTGLAEKCAMYFCVSLENSKKYVSCAIGLPPIEEKYIDMWDEKTGSMVRCVAETNSS